MDSSPENSPLTTPTSGPSGLIPFAAPTDIATVSVPVSMPAQPRGTMPILHAQVERSRFHCHHLPHHRWHYDDDDDDDRAQEQG